MTSLRLGLRLAITPAARMRTALLALAAMLGTTILLVTLAAGRHQLVTATAYQTEMPRLVAVVVAVIVLPCAVLLATVARLSASLRDRRLANLRLIGLTANQTRLVGTGEAGGAALVGAVLGWLAFWLVRPLLLGHAPAGAAWGDFFHPSVADQVLVVVGVPVVAILASVLPARSSVDDALAVSRRADRRPPGWWRLLPLGVGVTICTLVVANGPDGGADPGDRLVVGLFAGVGLTAVGMLLVLPVLVRLLTRSTAGRSLGPAQRLAVRRLEAQPAGVARIIAALLIGLFLATGARFVLVAFESTPQYVQAEHNAKVQQRVEAPTTQQDAERVVGELTRIDGVTRVVDLAMLHDGEGREAMVATCAQLAAVGPGFTGCRDGQPMWLGTEGRSPSEEGPIKWRADDRSPRHVVTTPGDLETTTSDRPAYEALSPIYADMIIPPELAGELPPSTSHSILVVGPPGPDLASRLGDLGYTPSYYGTEDYDFVATMRSVIWLVAGIVLGVGLLALTVSAIDRAGQRRKEVVALQLVGLGRGVIRRAQALETAVPVVVGSVLAVGLGALAGTAYLSLDSSMSVPWEQTAVLAAVAVVGGLVVAAVSMVACAPRLRPEEIRAE